MDEGLRFLRQRRAQTCLPSCFCYTRGRRLVRPDRKYLTQPRNSDRNVGNQAHLYRQRHFLKSKRNDKNYRPLKSKISEWNGKLYVLVGFRGINTNYHT